MCLSSEPPHILVVNGEGWEFFVGREEEAAVIVEGVTVAVPKLRGERLRGRNSLMKTSFGQLTLEKTRSKRVGGTTILKEEHLPSESLVTRMLFSITSTPITFSM